MAKKHTRPDKALQSALQKAYTERAKLFVTSARERSVQPIVEFLGRFNKPLNWALQELGISEAAFSKVADAGVSPHMVFCHPDVLQERAKALAYYRSLGALSAKGLGQLTAGTTADQRLAAKISVINNLLSAIVEDMKVFDLALAQAVIPLEIGAEVQGTWVNIIGRGAAGKVKNLITTFAGERGLTETTEKHQITVKGKKRTETRLVLKKGWTIVFGDEPDVSIRDKRKVLRVAIEIKGSMDKAGAQTRYGEAKKSFGKAISENARCETIYLASCFTDAVLEQIAKDQQVRKHFNLVDILADDEKRDEFLTELFRYQMRLMG